MRVLVLLALVGVSSASGLATASGQTQAAVQTPGPVRLAVQPGSRLWLDGGSNIHDWSCKAATFEAIVDGQPGEASHDGGPLQPETIQRVSVKVAVRDLKCGNAQMEKDLYAALKVGDSAIAPQIFAAFNASPGASTHGPTIETDGTITVAGVEKTIHMPITIERRTDGRVTVHGSVPLLMTDFAVTPPKALRGLVRSHNDVVVRFELILPNIGPR